MTDLHITIRRWQRLLTIIFWLVSVLAGGLLTHQLVRGLVLETDLQMLFPREQDSQLINRANDRLVEEFGDQLLLAVRAPERSQALSAANYLEDAIASSGFIQLQQDEQLQSIVDQQRLLQAHRFQLLTEQQGEWLRSDNSGEMIRRAQTALFGFSTASQLSPLQDPMAFFADYAQGLQPYVPGEIVDDRLVISGDGQTVVLFSASLQGDAFNLAIHKKLKPWLEDFHQRLRADQRTEDVTLLVSGAVFHAAEASTNAQREVTIISVGSSLGILLLFWLTFRRLKPLLLSFASIIYGSAVALAVNHFLFGQLHLMTLVFGASLIGVAVDYSLHYLCKHQGLSATHNLTRSTSVLEKLLSILCLSLVTSLLGYGCLLQAKLPGLQQIASFSIIGLAASWLFVVALYPYLFRAPLPQPVAVVNHISSLPWRLLPRLSTRQLSLLAVIVLSVLVWAFAQMRIGSDLRLLYKPSAELLHSEKTLQQLLQGFAPNQYFLLRAETEEALLQKEEQFRGELLGPLLANGAVRDYAATSRIVPSQARQQENYLLLREKIYREQGLADSFMRSAGFAAPAIAKLQSEFVAAQSHYLTVQDWLAVARPDQRLLWLGEVDGNYASIIALRGVHDVAALAAGAERMEGVMWVDRVADMSRILKQLQESATVLLGLAYIVVVGLMWISYRRAQAMLLVAVPLLATAMTLGLLSLAGVSINLFHIFGCYLILGLGMDYSIFAYQSDVGDGSCHRAILLSVLTSGLAFGLLALSSTPMVSAFGITLLLGSTFNLLLAPLLGRLSMEPR